MDHFVDPIMAIAGFEVESDGFENLPEGPALYVSNHQGLWDIPIVLRHIGPIRPIVAKKESEKLPVLHMWMCFFDCVYIDRNDPRQSLKCLQRVEELLKEGKSVVIFPEGTRSRGPQMGEFKQGSMRPAIKTGLPIVPIAIDGSYKGKEETGRITPCKCKVHILPPVETKGKDKTQIHDEVVGEIKKALGL